jgi:serine/threonine protein kinase
MNQDDRLGPYRLLRRLGEGGMGVVHLAVDSQGRQVAVKVLRSEVAGDAVARRRLSREVETMRRVRNRYIAEVLDADVTGSRPYIVTRYVPGRPLDEIVKEDGPLGADALVRVAYGVAEALATVHAAGVIHRDLKPGNVLMMDGDPVLIDFGIAQAMDATRLTQTGMFIGTPGYLAPEIIEGHEAGPEIDVHAWAGTLLFAATGQPPFGKGTLEMIFFNITAGKANVDGAPQLLRPILRAALSREPSKRPSAAELARETVRMLPTAPRPSRPLVPDEITTVPNLDAPEASGTRRGQERQPPVVRPPVPQPPEPRTPGPHTSGQQPSIPRPPLPQPATPPVSVPPVEEFVSLLPPPTPSPGDPFPTVRVTGQDLRSAGLLPRDPQGGRRDAPGVPGEAPGQRTGGQPPARNDSPGGSQPWDVPTGPAAEGDIPTRRVQPSELADLAKGSGVRPVQRPPGFPGSPAPAADPIPLPGNPAPQGGHGHGAQGHGSPGPPRERQPEPVGGSQAFRELAPDNLYEQTPHRQRLNPLPVMPTVNVPPPQPPHPGHAPGQLLRRSRAYGMASLLLLLITTAAAVRAPVLVLIVAVPVAVLLRAADIAQPQLNARRPAGAAAADVLRVLGQPAALVKSAAITVALVPYALILGLPVTLLLTVLVGRMSTANALSWGTAVALWTICAGPGVEGPGRQMRRTLASMLPTRSAAMAVAWVLGVMAAVAVMLALATFVSSSQQATWQPINTLNVIDRLDELRKKAQ